MKNNTEIYFDEINNGLDVMNDTMLRYEKVVKTEYNSLDIEVYEPKSNYENKIEKYKNVSNIINETSSNLASSFSSISNGIVGIMQTYATHKENMLKLQYDIKKIDLDIKAMDNALTKDLSMEKHYFEIIKTQLNGINNICNIFLEQILKIDSAKCSDKEFEEKQKIIEKINNIIDKSCDMIISYFSR